ncbi:hypothetical protein T492DRAFT_840962 [Pavlovales sp. CCMP2436]|nr:hypothetical protein T492DRAFT_840962 [Pavlovales sp. CCMP2436]
MNMIWDVRMLYVAVSRVRTLEQLAVIMSAKQTRYMGEGVEHRTEKARQFGLARAAGQGAIEEYPIGDGRYIADLAVFDIAENGKMKLVKLVEVVVTNPPSKEKLEYYKELGLECKVVYIEKEPPKQSNLHSPFISSQIVETLLLTGNAFWLGRRVWDIRRVLGGSRAVFDVRQWKLSPVPR